MSKYEIHYWYADLSNITGYQKGDVINDQELLKLITDKKVNVMVKHMETCSLCFIDDLNHRFQQR